MDVNFGNSRPFSLGVEEEFQLSNGESTSSTLALRRGLRVPRAGTTAADPVRADAVDRGGRDARRRQRRRGGRGGSRAARAAPRRGGRARRADRLRRHASVLALRAPGDHRRAALPGADRVDAVGGRARADLRAARPRRARDAAAGDRGLERAAHVAAGAARALGELAVLAGPRHRLRLHAGEALRRLSAQRAAAGLRRPSRSSSCSSSAGSRPARSRTTRSSGGTCGRTRSSARSRSASATARHGSRAWPGSSRSSRASSPRSPSDTRPSGTLPIQPVTLVDENKWRAARYGLDAQLIDLEHDDGAAGPRGRPRARRALAQPAARRLGCADELGRSRAALRAWNAGPTSSSASTRRRREASWPSRSGSLRRRWPACRTGSAAGASAILTRRAPSGRPSSMRTTLKKGRTRPGERVNGNTRRGRCPLLERSAPVHRSTGSRRRPQRSRPRPARADPARLRLLVARARRWLAASPAASTSGSTRASRPLRPALDGREAAAAARRRRRCPGHAGDRARDRLRPPRRRGSAGLPLGHGHAAPRRPGDEDASRCCRSRAT